MMKAYQAPELAGMFTTYQVNVPQLYADIDRTRARQLGVPVTEIFDTMQVYLGSLYVNDFNKFGRTYSVRVQADAPYRARAEDIGLLKVRSNTGEMVPLSALMNVRPARPRARDPLQRLPRGRHQRRHRPWLLVGPGAGRGRAHRRRDPAARHRLRVDRDHLPGDPRRQSAIWVFPLAILLVFLVLAAQYESLALPLAIILIVPMCLLAALTGVWLTARRQQHLHADRLHGAGRAGGKNAILIVEFARELEFAGRTPVQAAIEASRLRLRPILMTSIAFIMGVLPLCSSTAPAPRCARRWASRCSPA